MASKRKGYTVVSKEWAKHLRKWGKRKFWKAMRQNDRKKRDTSKWLAA